MGNANGVDLTMPEVPEIETLFKNDGYLRPFEAEIRRRYGCFKNYIKVIKENEGGLMKFTESYKNYGIQVDDKKNVTVLEWAPGAKNIYLRGDFNDWKYHENKFEKLPFGKWELKLPALADGSCAIKHGSFLKVNFRRFFFFLMLFYMFFQKFILVVD